MGQSTTPNFHLPVICGSGTAIGAVICGGKSRSPFTMDPSTGRQRCDAPVPKASGRAKDLRIENPAAHFADVREIHQDREAGDPVRRFPDRCWFPPESAN